jgi:hypothetical protein
MQHQVRRALGPALAAPAFALVVAALLAVGAPAWSATAGCEGPVRDLRQAFAALNPTGTTAPEGSAEADRLRQQGTELYAAALKAHPECTADINQLLAERAAAARSQAVEKGTPFLGPIGWLWNNVYYRVFSGNDVMMALFGWALLLSPLILVVATIWVLRGASQGLHKPYVPEHLRVDQ